MQCPATQDAVLLSSLDKKAKRDLYAEMMRADNPGFSCFTESEILANFTPNTAALFADPPANGATPPVRTKRSVECVTQKNSSVDELFLGLNKGTLFLWEKGSKINWTARTDGYRSKEDALFSARACYTAAAAWNKALSGLVQFAYVDTFDDACFQLVYGGVDRRGVLASAFFPDEYGNVLNSVIVFQGQLEGPYKSEAVNTFAHELGHVLGLRHEHSQDTPTIPGLWGEVEDKPASRRGAESVLFGSRNPYSIMAYYNAMKIQDSDVKDAREAYETLENDSVFKGEGLVGQGQKFTIEKTVYRVRPDN
jgi:hypothetical protein